MNKLILFILLTTSYFFLSKEIYGQNIQETYILAQKSYADKRYENAISYFQRTIYYGDSIDKIKCYIGLADSYVALSDYEKAQHYYDLFLSICDNDSLKIDAVFSKIRLLIISKRLDLASMEFFRYKSLLTKYDYRRVAFYKGMIHFHQGQYDEAQTEFCMSINDSTGELAKQIDQIIRHVKRYEKRYNPQLAKNLSLYLFSSGQFYIGEFKEGLNTLVLNISLFALFSYVSYHYTMIDAIILITPWLTRYYTGGYMRAYKLAVMKRERNRIEDMNQLLAIMAKANP